MARQDEKQRLRRRLQDYAMQLATTNSWKEAIDVNHQILEMGEDPATYNRLGKAYMEQGRFVESHDAYQQTLRLNPTNTIARRNVARLESLLARGINYDTEEHEARQQVDLRLFITEAGKTRLATLVDVPRSTAVEVLSTGEKVDLVIEERRVVVVDADGDSIGYLEPKIGQRLAELMSGGNRYIAAIAQSDPRQVRILIREIYQDPSQRGRTSFPVRLGEEGSYDYLTIRYDYDTDDLLEEEDVSAVPEALEEELGGDDEEDIRLDSIESDMSDDDAEEE